MRRPLKTSALGFGCASVMGKVGKRQALSAMSEAFANGVTHFDVARSYGFGQAENVLGQFAKGRRDRITITTKFGVVPPRMALKTRMLVPVAREMLRLVPALGARMRSQSARLLADKRFDVAYARQCLEQSLTALRTDYIDFYMLHEPAPENAAVLSDLAVFLEKCVTEGKVRRWGVAYRNPQDMAVLSSMVGDAVQFESSIGKIKEVPTEILQESYQRFAMRPFGGGMHGAGLSPIIQNESPISRAMHDLGLSPADLALCVASKIAGSEGTVVCAMFEPQHIRANVRAITELAPNPAVTDLADTCIRYLKPEPIKE